MTVLASQDGFLQEEYIDKNILSKKQSFLKFDRESLDLSISITHKQNQNLDPDVSLFISYIPYQ